MDNVDLLCVLLAAVCSIAAVADGSSLRARRALPHDPQPLYYTNVWAVEVDGGEKEADALAAKHHFVNKGQVCQL